MHRTNLFAAAGAAAGLTLFAATAAAVGPEDVASPSAVAACAAPAGGPAGPGATAPSAPAPAPDATTGDTTGVSAPSNGTMPSGVERPSTTAGTTAATRQAPGAEGAAEPSPAAASIRDTRFLRTAAASNLFEIATGELAAERSEGEEVRAFGAHLAADHTAALAELRARAASLGVDLPDALDPVMQADVDALAALHGAAFDRAFLEVQIDAHRAAITAHDGEAADGDEPCTRLFAAAALPVLAGHLAEAYRLSVTADAATSTTSTTRTDDATTDDAATTGDAANDDAATDGAATDDGTSTSTAGASEDAMAHGG